MPWQGKVSHSKDDKYYKIREIKKQTTPEQLCEGLPKQFEYYIKYTRSLQYESDPDYNYLKNLFLSVLKSYKWELDYYYDWDQTTLSENEVNNSLNMINNNYSHHQIPKLYSKINELKNERKLYGGQFEVERFVFDFEEESNFTIIRKRIGNRKIDEREYYEYTNSITPYARNHKKKVKHTGCMPCKPKEYKEDDGCCLIY